VRAIDGSRDDLQIVAIMLSRRVTRLRASIAVAIFAMASGAPQLADGLVYHRKPEPVPITRINAGDHCHAESCDLDEKLATPPPASPPEDGGRLEPPIRAAGLPVPVDAPRTRAPSGPIGSRAPPTTA
jgi:hypothetical protein